MTKIIRKIKLRQYQFENGTLVENTFKKIVQESKHFFVSKFDPRVVRGNHYHRRKSEWFYLIQGTCKVCVIDLKTKQKEEFILKDRQNLMLNLKPNIAHAFKNVGKNETILLALVNEVHDQNDPDTYRYKLL